VSRWFRHYAGMCSDPKFGGIARRAKVGRDRAVFVFAYILECASEANAGGAFAWDADAVADILNCETAEITAVFSEIEAAGLIAGGVVTSWAKFNAPAYSDDLRPPTHIWAAIRDRVFARDDFTCAYCGARGVKLECDHVVPVSRGGSNSDENLVAACKPCNRSKSNMLVEEWAR
jgi:hypothetical protein